MGHWSPLDRGVKATTVEVTQKYLFEYLPYFSTDIGRTTDIPSRNVSVKRRRSGARILRRGMVE